MEQKEVELYKKFPMILQKKLIDGDVKFPDDINFDYEKFLAYRMVARTDNDFSDITREDMKSYAELGKKPKRVQGFDESDPDYYSASFYTNVEKLKNSLKFPRKNKKIIQGYIYQEGGPQKTVVKTTHVSWWLFSDVTVDNFTYYKEDKNG